MIPWLDTETTGLDYTSDTPDCILELGIVITDDALNVVAHDAWIVHPGECMKPIRDIDPFVIAMHSKSGLLRDCMDSELADSIEDAQGMAIAFLEAHGATGLPMFGSTIGFDRGILHRWMRPLHDTFHYRSVDVSSMKEMVRLHWPEFGYPKTNEEDKMHRVIEDILESIEEYRYYLGLFDPRVMR